MLLEIEKKIIPFCNVDAAVAFIKKNKGLYVSMNLQALVDDELLTTLAEPNVYGYVDGIGAQFFLKRKFGVTTPKIPGCELWLDILQSEVEHSYSIAVIGASAKSNDEAVNKLNVDFPQHSVDYYVDGFNYNESQVLEELSNPKYDLVFIALGQPRQELLGLKVMQSNPSITVLGLGGSLDVYTGNVTRAPQVFIDLKMEWLYRVLLQPRRIGKLIGCVCKYVVLLLK